MKAFNYFLLAMYIALAITALVSAIVYQAWWQGVISFASMLFIALLIDAVNEDKKESDYEVL